MVAVVTVLFLVATVLFALAQMRNVSGGNVIDGQRQSDNTAAFFLAESGLETAQAAYSAALVGGAVSNTSCTGIASAVNLGRGSATLSAVSTPATCAGTACTGCALTAVGLVGGSTRTLTRSFALTTENGVFCKGSATHNCNNSSTPPKWQLTLANTSAYDGVAIFNLAYTAKGNNAAICDANSYCQLQFDLGSPSAGLNSSGIMGNSVNIPAGLTYSIFQRMDSNDRNLVEIGAIFKGLTAAPVLTGSAGAGGASFWDAGNGNSTIGSGSNTGATNNGTASATGTCSATSANVQACTNWCYGGDTLVMSYAAKVTGLADGLSAVSFNSTTSQAVAMQQIAKYPTTLVTGAPVDVEAEIWVVRNPNLVGNSPDAVNASSYKGRGTGGFGASWGGNDASNMSGTTLTVGSNFSSGTAYPAQIISPGSVGVGDTISSTGGSAASNVNCSAGCPTITAQLTSTEPGGALGGRGTYTLSTTQSVSSTANRVWTVASNVLNLTGCTVCFFGANDALNGLSTSRTISSQQIPLGTVVTRGRIEATEAVGRYLTVGSPAATLFQAAGSAVRAGTPGNTVYVPSTSNLPAVTTPAMRVGVKSGAGVLAANSTVSAVSSAGSPSTVTRSFVLSSAPSTPLDDVTLCAGICAYFDRSAVTVFQITKSGGTQEWASAFTCLRGVTVTPEVVTSSSSASNRWTETIN